MRPPCNPRTPEIFLKSSKFCHSINTSKNKTMDQKAKLSKSPLTDTPEESKWNGRHEDFHYCEAHLGIRAWCSSSSPQQSDYWFQRTGPLFKLAIWCAHPMETRHAEYLGKKKRTVAWRIVHAPKRLIHGPSNIPKLMRLHAMQTWR